MSYTYDRLIHVRGHTLRIVVDGDDVVLFHDSARLAEAEGGYFDLTKERP